MKNILYLDGTCGISGDMFVASLLSLGGDESILKEALTSLRLEDEFSVEISQKKSYSILGTDFNVILKHNKDDHLESIHCEHHHEHAHEHNHTHNHHHIHRHLKDINEIIDNSKITNNAKNIAKNIFLIVAKAESKAHGCDINEVHFHEVGAIDSIIDIVSASILIDNLNISKCIITNLNEGQGFVTCAHGDLPIPVPAVLNILDEYKIPFSITNAKSEMITPTGIAILASLNPFFSLPKNFTILNQGIGLGKRDFGRPNILRALLIKEEPRDSVCNTNNDIIIIETNIDNDTGENLSFTMEKLFEAGAKDVHIIPCYMKKNRMGHILRVVTSQNELDNMIKIIFTYTTTIGVKYYNVDSICMNKEFKEVLTSNYGKIKLKECTYKDIKKVYPEFESLKEASNKFNVSINKIKSEL